MQQLLFSELARIKDLRTERNVRLEGLTTFKIGGKARLFLTPFSISALEKSLKVLVSAGTPFRILGRGSNLLVSDKGVNAVINLSGLSGIERSDNSLTVFSGMTVSRLLKWCLDNNYGGMEQLAGIPATLGGALFMNAGACGCEISSFVEKILLTGPDGSSWTSPSAHTFSYRKSHLPSNMIISAVRLRMSDKKPVSHHENCTIFPCSSHESLLKIKKTMKKRLQSQPLGQPSAGCVFRNPARHSAWSLIAKCGLQGLRNGDAAVSEKHANFIVNRGDAKFLHVKDLISIIKEKVREQTGILLKEELIIWEDDIIK